MKIDSLRDVKNNFIRVIAVRWSALLRRLSRESGERSERTLDRIVALGHRSWALGKRVIPLIVRKIVGLKRSYLQLQDSGRLMRI